MIDVTKASRETLEAFAANELEWDETSYDHRCRELSLKHGELLTKLRAECAAPKLRSRAEVDAELAAAIRIYVDKKSDRLEQWKDIERLCAEPTAEEPAECPTCHGRHPGVCSDAFHATEPAELDLAEHEVCSCDEAEKLKARVAELELKMARAGREATYLVARYMPDSEAEQAWQRILEALK